MLRYIVSIIFMSGACFATSAQVSDESDLLTKQSSQPTQALHNKEIVLNQSEFKDRLQECDASTKLIVSGPISDKLNTLLMHTYLTDIDFSGSYVKDSELREICKIITNLRSLNIAGSPITNAGLENLPKLIFLEKLNITDTLINSNGLKQIPSKIKVITSKE